MLERLTARRSQSSYSMTIGTVAGVVGSAGCHGSCWTGGSRRYAFETVRWPERLQRWGSVHRRTRGLGSLTLECAREWNDREPYGNQWSSETARARLYENGTSDRYEHGPMLALVRQLPFENETEFPGSKGSGRHFTALNMSTSCFFTLPRVSEKQD